MKDYELLDAVGGISPKYIESAKKSKEASEKRRAAAEERTRRRNRFPMWTKQSLVAACVCLAVVGGMLLNTGTQGGGAVRAPGNLDTKTRGMGADTMQDESDAIPKEAETGILKETDYGNSSDEPLGESTSEAPNDISVDENAHSDERTYSPDIQSLQDLISDAMKNNELPFVVSSMILENPDRVHVTVNTTDEESINLLKAYDPTGELLEIEYSTDLPVTE